MPTYSQIINLIKHKAYIPLDELMQQVMSALPDSYYRHQNKLGAHGDFTTAPEISQLFGEMIALWIIDKWYKMGCPKRINLVELGPGCGTLMRDLLNVAKLVPEFYQSLEIELLEINPYFINTQKTVLQQFTNTNSLKHISLIEDISLLPSIIIANEFFDALPIKQYIKNRNLWYEIVITTDLLNAQLKFDQIQINSILQNYLLQKYHFTVHGAIIEKSIQALDIIKFISKHISIHGGASLIIDYGYDINPLQRKDTQYTSTLQAIMNHQYCPILKTLGRADLSSHVDFFELKTIAKNLAINVHGTITQRDFLINNGIMLRSQTLQNKLSANEANIISKQVDRLIAVDKMGLLFKVLELTSPNFG